MLSVENISIGKINIPVNYVLVGLQMLLVPTFVFTVVYIFEKVKSGVHVVNLAKGLSYPIYLMHIPVFCVIATLWTDQTAGALIVVFVTIGTAYLYKKSVGVWSEKKIHYAS